MKYLLSKKTRRVAAALAVGLAISLPATSHAGTDLYLGELMPGGWNFCPRGTAEADGQLLAISSNTALFSLLGTQFGGDGRTTFGLPDLRGRSPLHEGTGPGLPNIRIGQRGGAVSTTITTAQMPPHNHSAWGTKSLVDKAGSKNALPGPISITPPVNQFSGAGVADRQFKTTMIGNTGGGQSIQTQSPYLGITWCIATVGVFPSRN